MTRRFRYPLARLWPLVLVAALLTLSVLWAWTPNDVTEPACDRDRNGAWISVDWASQPTNPEAIARLANSARVRGIRYLFPYVSYLKPNGDFNQTYTHAKAFVTAYRRVNPDTKLLAWIGLPLTTTASSMPGWVDLSDRNTRQLIGTFVVDIVAQAGFDGVHLNAEPVLRDSADFLHLLEEIRQVIGPDKLISVAGHHWASDSSIAIQTTTRADWSGRYYQAVAERVNQIAVMTYDSQLTSPLLYRLWVREQVRGIEQSLHATNATLLIGLSVSREETASHHPNAETLADGLAGFCAAAAQQLSKVEGVAIYADWEFAESDGRVWQAWQSAN